MKIYFFVMCLGKQIDQIGRETCTETLTKRTTVSFFSFDKVFINLADGPFK